MIRRFALLIVFIPAFLFAQGEKLFTVKQLYGSQEFHGNSMNGVHWFDGGRKFTYQQFDTATKSMNIYSRSVNDDSRELLVDASTLKVNPDDKAFQYTNWQFSPDERKILFISAPPERRYLSRLTPAGNLFLYDLKRKSFKQLTKVHEPQYNVKFSPDGTKLAYVRANNIYLLDIASGGESQLTSDGAEHVINGKFDWVYEEEFGISDGFSFSPDGKSIAYWRLDESRIPQFTMVDFGTPDEDIIPERYPKPGDPNSIVKIGVVSLETKKSVWMDLGTNDDIYVPRMRWTPKPNTIAVQRLNRLQNKIELMFGDARTGRTTVFFTEEEKTYIEGKYDLRFLDDKGQFLWISERDGYSHVYRFDNNGALVNRVTKGMWDVDNVLYVDEQNNAIYFSAPVKTPIEHQIHSVRLDGTGLRQLTQDGYSHSASFSPDGKYFIDHYSNFTTPTKIALFTNEGKLVRVLEENPMKELSEYKMGKTEFFTFKTSDGVDLNGWMIKPVDFDSRKKYPVLFSVYGGPGSQTVVNRWGGVGYLWHQMLAERGYIIVSVDGRGTGFRGKEFRAITYKNLGKWEVNDQIEAAKWLGAQPYVDASRIGIWGWSYGGYMAALTILKGADYFKTAVAVAPVTSWALYDDIYTERYMQRPQDNPEGYKESAPITYADKLKGNLLIVHGTADDNVHWQNTVQLVDALQKAGKQFQTMFYLNKNHGIAGGNTRVHLFEMITNYIVEKL